MVLLLVMRTGGNEDMVAQVNWKKRSLEVRRSRNSKAR